MMRTSNTSVKLTRALIALAIGIFLSLKSLVLADYDDEIRRQTEVLKERYATGVDHSYFYDMGILARKADEAHYDDLAAEIIGTLLFKKMDEYVDSELKEINLLYLRDPLGASRRLKELAHYQRYYQPTSDYLLTASGQAYSSELVHARETAVEALKLACIPFELKQSLSANRKTGLYITNKSAEIYAMQDLSREIDCCIRWKSKINFYKEIFFETDYEEGLMTEEAQLKLKTSPSDLSAAQWEGEWVYKFKGREGTAQGVSKATLTFRKAEDIADLVITAARITSAGRVNLPVSLAGDHRTLEVEGEFIYPELVFAETLVIPLVGCRENEIKK